MLTYISKNHCIELYLKKKNEAYNHSSLTATKLHTDQSQELAVKEES